jgi:NADH-quinone oxidoreductase subunit C/D
MQFLKNGIDAPYAMLYDLTAIDERTRVHRDYQPPGDFTVVYHLLSFGRNEYVRLKVGLHGHEPSLPSIIPIWPAANWYEREVWDMFGITFEGHPHLERLLMPQTWVGHPCARTIPRVAPRLAPST